MDYGIALATTTESWKVAKRAEDLGFSHAWFYDTQLLNTDVFMGMAQAAMATERIRLGTGVLVPSNRIEPVTANCLATLNRMAPGRVDFGVGTGFTARRTMGLPAIRLSEFRAHLARVQGLLRGERVTCEFDGQEREIAFLNPDYGFINLEDEIPLHISAFGPKSRALAAELQAGWINFTGDTDRAVHELQLMQASWNDAGNAEPLYSTLFLMGAVLQEGEGLDSPRVRAQAGPFAAVLLHNLVETTTPETAAQIGLPPAWLEKLEGYRALHDAFDPRAPWLSNHRGHLMKLRDDDGRFVDGEFIGATSFTGRPEDLRARVARLEAAGYSQITVQLVEGELDAIEDWAALFGLGG